MNEVFFKIGEIAINFMDIYNIISFIFGVIVSSFFWERKVKENKRECLSCNKGTYIFKETMKIRDIPMERWECNKCGMQAPYSWKNKNNI